MRPLSKSIEQIQRSPIRIMFDKAENMTDVISFAVGEPGFTAAEHIIEAAKACLDRGDTHYTSNAGTIELRKAISQYFLRKKNVSYDPQSEIIVTIGGMQGLYLSMLVLTEPGDEIILCDPCYANYIGEAEMCRVTPRFVTMREEDNFQLRMEEVASAITPRTKAILINSPCNPTGSVLTEKTLRDLAQLCIEKDIYLITDEVYQDFIYDDAAYFSIASLPGMKERTILIDSVSKTYAMTGWRCGMLAGPQEIISQMVKIQEFMVSCVPNASQAGAVAALLGGDETLQKMKAQYSENRQLVIEAFKDMPNLSLTTPKGAFYAFFNIKKTGLDSLTFCLQALEEAHVVLSPGSAFGPSGEGYVRISYVTSVEDLKEGLKRLRAFAEKLAAK